jgi:predicted SnoaL-like aldol condensation-catalyzing enzyme
MTNGNSESLMAQWFRRVWNESDVSAIDELALPNMASHGLMSTIEGRDAWLRNFYMPMRAALSDIKVELLDEAVNGDKIFGRLVATQVPKMTNGQVSMHGMCVMRVENGKLAEAWDTWDFLGLLESMKLMPAGSFAQAITGELKPHPAATKAS